MTVRQPTIAILTLAADNFRKERYLLHPMILRWEAMGFRVVIASDDESFVPADLGLLHVDLSVVPDAYQRLAGRYPRVLNGRVVDIRKRHFSRLLVDREGPDPGAVIVKSNWNYGGRRDFQQKNLASPAGLWLRRIHLHKVFCDTLEWLERRRSWPQRRWLSTYAYRVFSKRAEVPAAVWTNPNLVVERFLSERKGSSYCCRHWLFFGDREVSRRTVSVNPIVKAGARLEPLSDPVPDELRVIRQQMGFDYGKFDYGIVDGQVILYDANRTPGITRNPERHTETVEVLSAGIRGFFD